MFGPSAVSDCETSGGSAVGMPKTRIADNSIVLCSTLALQQPWSSSVIMIICCHAQIFVGVVTYIGAYRLLSAHYLSTYCYYVHVLINQILRYLVNTS